MDDVVVTVGGTIPTEDIAGLQEVGVAAAFSPASPRQDIVDFIRDGVVGRPPA